MKKCKKTVLVAIAGLCLVGCQTQTEVQPPPPKPAPTVEPAPVVEKKPEPPPPAPVPKKRTQEQIRLLQDFAIKESPKIWQTIQSMRAEMTTSETKLKQLRADLLEFGRNPDADEDYKALVAGQKELRSAYDAIFDKLEDAYIAAKKYEASPSRKDHRETMKRALEDGIQNAAMATERYKAMTNQK